MVDVKVATRLDLPRSDPEKLILITGATSGIGLHLALTLAQRGARLILVGRNPAHAQNARRLLERAAPGTNFDLRLTDLSRLDNVRALAADIRAHYPHLDVLFNNSGGLFLRRSETTDGYERTFALNHLSPFLLTHELLPLLRAGAPSRIVTTASEAHRGGRLHFDDLQLRHGYNVWAAYAQSKLANVMFTYELSRRLGAEPISAHCFHPGLVRTNLGKNNVFIGLVMSLGYRLLGRDPKKAAGYAVELAVSPAFQTRSGSYVIDGKRVRSSTASYDEQSAQALWKASQRLTGIGDDWGFGTG